MVWSVDKLIAVKQHHEAERARLVGRIAPLGKKRAQLIARLERLDAELRPLVVEATAAGVSYRRLQDLTRLGPSTIAKWKRRSTS